MYYVMMFQFVFPPIYCGIECYNCIDLHLPNLHSSRAAVTLTRVVSISLHESTVHSVKHSLPVEERKSACH